MPPKFFITHSWKDIEFARRLHKDLAAHGVEGWMDDSVVLGGQRLAEEINRGLEGCDVYLPIMSPAALDSPWCWEEINAAIALTNRRDRAKQLRIISVIAERCEMPALLSARLYFDFVASYDDALNDLLNKGFSVSAKATPPRSLHPASTEPAKPLPPEKDKSKSVVKATPKSAAKIEPAPEEVENLYLEALEAFHLEKWQPAADGFRKVIAIQSDYEDAAAKLKLAERALHEAELSALYDGATKLIEANKWREAIEQLESLLKIDAEYKDTPARLASAKNMLQAADLYMQASEALAAKRWSDAVRALESLLTLAPNYQDAATKLVEAKRWAQLPDLYRRALKAFDVKQWQDAQTLLEQIQSVDAKYRESKELLARVRESALADLYDRAMQAIETKQWQDAKNLLEQIRKIDSNYRETSQRLALVEKKLIPRKITNPKDGKELLLIPASEFVMGSDEGEAREKPPHKVYLDTFYISRYPVTNAEYKKFVDATKRDVPFVEESWAKPYNWDKKTRTFPKDKPDHPVVLVTWGDAVAYSEWADARLPTEAEWEKAASWDELKKEKRVYPWGKDFDVSKCNSAESTIGSTTPVSKYCPHGESAYDIADMAGNVWEWCADWYGEDYYKSLC